MINWVAVMFVSSLVILYIAGGIATGATVRNWRNPSAWISLAFIAFGAAASVLMTINGHQQRMTTACLRDVIATEQAQSAGLIAVWSSEPVDRTALAQVLLDNPEPTC